MAHVRLFRHYIHVPFVILGLIDLVVLAFSFCIAVFFRHFGEVSFFLDNIQYLLPSAIAFGVANLVVMIALGVHQSRLEEGMSGMMLRTIFSLIIGVPASAFIFLLGNDWLWYLGFSDILTSASVFGLFLLGISRWIFFGIAGKDAFKRKVLVLGAGAKARQLLEDLKTPFNRKGFIITGFVPLPDEPVQIRDESLLLRLASLHL
ncbi:MAG: nucleoside-diphosphate sugar epimerase/dehydratase [Marinobacter sp.]|uniref:nucleoside-diphosphate sugar epimerase/dehydratase n=1 Tax=Marinobacter sp. TaxID=50741 RepID=UPI003C63BF53